MSREDLFKSNQSLVPYVFYKYFPSKEKYKDVLLQEGLISLWKASKAYDESLGYSFCTYACSKIFFGMKNYLNRQVYVESKEISLEDAVGDEVDGDLCMEDVLRGTEDTWSRYMIDHCFSKMHTQDRKILKAIMLGYSQEEVAKIAGVSQPTISRTITRFKTIFEREKRL